MPKSVLRVERGLFKYDNVFESIEYNSICLRIEESKRNGHFSVRQHIEDEGVDDHPLWLEQYDPSIQNDIVNFINTTNISSLFGFVGPILLTSLSASFILYYQKNQNKSSKQVALTPHNDLSLIPNKHILSVVYTIRSNDCIGGTLEYSNKWNGTQKYSRDMNKFDPKDNSIYCFNGNYVSHAAYGVDHGYRYAIVLFFNTPQSNLDVSILWNYPNTNRDSYCCKCYKGFCSIKQLKEHNKKCLLEEMITST